MAVALKTLTVPEDEAALRQKSLPVADFGAEFQTLVDNMIETVHSWGSMGLAAIQVGVPLRVLVAVISGNEPIAYVNPVVVSSSGNVVMDEGCMSVPWKMGRVSRAASIVVDAFDRYGKPVRLELDTLPARIFGHEMEHLDGGLYYDHLEGELITITPGDDEGRP